MPAWLNVRRWPFSRKITAALIAVMFCVLGGGSFALSFLLRGEIVRLIRANMRSQFVYYQSFINNTTSTMLGNGRDVARFGEILQRTAVSLAQADIESERYLLHKISGAPEILGTGLWYEPGALFPHVHYFGPYAYWQNEEAVITREYNAPGYNYHSHDWYTMAVPANWNRALRRPHDYYISRPYPDMLGDKQVYFITISTPMYNQAGHIIGVSSTDWSLDTITAYLEKFALSAKSFLVLIDCDNNLVLYHPRRELILQPVHTLEWFDSIRRRIPADNTPLSTDTVRIDGTSHSIIAGRTDIGYQLVMAVPMAESYARQCGSWFSTI
jgi:hypothetical protein